MCAWPRGEINPVRVPHMTSFSHSASPSPWCSHCESTPQYLGKEERLYQGNKYEDGNKTRSLRRSPGNATDVVSFPDPTNPSTETTTDVLTSLVLCSWVYFPSKHSRQRKPNWVCTRSWPFQVCLYWGSWLHTLMQSCTNTTTYVQHLVSRLWADKDCKMMEICTGIYSRLYRYTAQFTYSYISISSH